MSRLGEVIGVGVVLVALWMSSREREGERYLVGGIVVVPQFLLYVTK
jgi:hypothetical protein